MNDSDMGDRLGDVNKVSVTIIEDYFKYLGIEPMQLDLIFTNDMIGVDTEIRKGDLVQLTESDKEALSKANGCMILPKDNNDMYHILISTDYAIDYMNNGFQFIVTLVHEITHILDYEELSSLCNTGGRENIRRLENESTFSYWSEYHAHYVSWKYFTTSFDCVDEIGKIVSDNKNKYKERLINNISNGGITPLYHLLAFFGIISAWMDVYPNDYSDSQVYKLLDYDNKLISLLQYLRTIDNVSIAYRNLDKLKYLYETLFKQ